MKSMWRSFKTIVVQRWLRPLHPQELLILQALGQGWTLKSHRYLDGRKLYKLHPLEGKSQSVSYTAVQKLLHKKLITTNQKFPAATFLLTSKGKHLLHQQQTSFPGLANIVKFNT